MPNRYEVKGTDEFFLHIQDNDEWPEDKAEGYIGNIWKTVDILNKQDQRIKELTNFKNKVFTILDEEIQYKKGLQELSEEQKMEMSLEKFTFELAMLMTIKRKLEEIK